MQKIALQKLSKLINPFKEDMFNLGSPLSEKDVASCIENFDFALNNSDTEKNIIIKRIAYFVKNYPENTVVINLGHPETGNDSEDLIESGKLTFAAAIIRNELEINAFIKGSQKLSKKLLSVDVSNDSFDEVQNENKFLLKPANLTLDLSDRISTWENKEFCLNKLTMNFKGNIDLINKKLFEDIDFMYDVVKVANKKDGLVHMSPDYLASVNLLSKVSKNSNDFIFMWNSIYEDILNKANYLDAKKNDFEYGEDLSNQEEKLVEYLTKNLFANKEFVNTIKNNKEINSIYLYLSEEIKKDDDLLKIIITNQKPDPNSYFNKAEVKYENIPLSFFDNPINAAHLINNYVTQEEECNKKFVKLITQNKNYMMSMIQAIDANKLTWIWNFIWSDKNLKKDKEIITLFMEKDRDIYQKLQVSEKKDMDHVLTFLNKGGSISHVPKDMLININDDELIKSAIRICPNVLSDKEGPEEWNLNKDYLLQMGSHISWLKYSPAKWTKIIGDKSKDYIDFIEMHPEMYDNFSSKIREREDVAIAYLSKKSTYGSNVPQTLFGSKNFCIKALAIDSELYRFVPSAIFTDEQFLKELLEKVDAGKISFNIISKNTELKKFFESFDITQQYGVFFNAHLLKLELSKKEITTSEKKMKI